jgi:hypothetical protein
MKIYLQLLSLLFAFSVSAQQPRLQSKDRRPVPRFKQIPGKLGLSHRQTKTFNEAVRKFREQRHRQNQDLVKQLKTILTPDQFEKLKKLIEEDTKK